MAKKIGELLVEVNASNARLLKSFEDSKRATDRFAGQFKTAMRAVAGSLAIRELGRFVQSTIDLQDRIGKLSRSTGVAVETLSAYRHGANLAGIDLDVVAKAVQRLNANIVDAAQNSKGEAAEGFRLLGLSVRDAHGSLKRGDQVLEEISEKFRTLPDGPLKTAAAMKLMGKAGADVIPFLVQNLREVGEAAKKTGQVFDAKAAAAAEKFNDAITDLKDNLQGLAITMTGPVVRAVNEVFDTFAGKLTAFANKRELLDSPLFKLVFGATPLGLFEKQISSAMPEFGIQRTAKESAAAQFDSMFEAGRKALARMNSEAALLNEKLRNPAAELFKKQLEGARDALRDANLALGLSNLKQVAGERGVFGFPQFPPLPSGIPTTDVPLGTELISPEQARRQAFADFERWLELNQRAVKGAGQLRNAYVDALAGIGGALDANLAHWRGWGNLLISVLDQVGAALIRNLTGTSGSGGLFSTLFGAIFGSIFAPAGTTSLLTEPVSFRGGFAHGGMLHPGEAGIVGELGPEPAFVTSAGALITPNVRALGGGAGGQVVNVSVDNRGADLLSIVRMNALLFGEGMREFARRQADLATRVA